MNLGPSEARKVADWAYKNNNGSAMQIMQTLMATDDDSGEVLLVDTISYEGKLWIVPHWLAARELGWQMPERIVCMDGLNYQEMNNPDYTADYVLTYPVPKSVLDGKTDTVEGRKYVVVERPDIQISVGSA